MRFGVRVLRPLARELQQREEIFNLIVGGERGVEQRREQQPAFAERVDYPVLFGHAGGPFRGGSHTS